MWYRNVYLSITYSLKCFTSYVVNLQIDHLKDMVFSIYLSKNIEEDGREITSKLRS